MGAKCVKCGSNNTAEYLYGLPLMNEELEKNIEQGKVKLGSTAILTGFGAGMTWGGAIVRLREGIC